MREPISNTDAVDLLRSSTVPHVERAVLAELAQHWPNIYPSLNRIARHTGLARSTTIAALKRLAKKGLITQHSAATKHAQQRAFSNGYTIHWEQIADAPPEDLRSVNAQLRQQLAESKRQLLFFQQTGSLDLVRHSDRVTVREQTPTQAGVTFDLVRKPVRPGPDAGPKETTEQTAISATLHSLLSAATTRAQRGQVSKLIDRKADEARHTLRELIAAKRQGSHPAAQGNSNKRRRHEPRKVPRNRGESTAGKPRAYQSTARDSRRGHQTPGSTGATHGHD
jgi:hypothetical protein